MNPLINKISPVGKIVAYYARDVVLPPGPFRGDELQDLLNRYNDFPYFFFKDREQSCEEFMTWLLASRF